MLPGFSSKDPTAFALARATRIGAAVLGFGAAAYLMMALLGRAIGKVIS